MQTLYKNLTEGALVRFFVRHIRKFAGKLLAALCTMLPKSIVKPDNDVM